MEDNLKPHKQENSMHGLKWGLIISAVYIVFLYLRFSVGGNNILYMGAFVIIGFIAAMVLLFLTGYTRRKQLGGYIELKDVFQTMFVAVVIYEFVYALFSFVYLKYIDPEFMTRISALTEDTLIKAGKSQSEVDEMLSKTNAEDARKMTGTGLLMSYLYGLAVSGVFALIFALILKKKRPMFEDEHAGYSQS